MIWIRALLIALQAASPAAEPMPTRLNLVPTVIFWQHLYAGDLSRPRGIFFDKRHEELWVADTRNNLIGVFTPDGVPLFSFGAEGLLEPTEIAVDGAGRVLVVDSDRTRIRLFSYRGESLGYLDLQGLKGRPVIGAITVDDDGNVYVGDSAGGQVLEYGPDGRLKLKLGGSGYEDGQFQAISGIAVTPDAIVVTDAQVTAVQVFDRRGNFVRGWGQHDIDSKDFSLASGVTVDRKGRVIAVDMLRSEIKEFDLEGNYLDSFGGMGAEPGAVLNPAGVTTDGHGRIYVVEQGNSRVQIFSEEEIPQIPGTETGQ